MANSIINTRPATGDNMQSEDQQTQGLSALQEQHAALNIIKSVHISKLKFLPNLFGTVLYEDTELQRTGQRGFIGKNEVLKKNVYFLATKTKNVSDTLLQELLNTDVITADEQNAICNQPTMKLRAVQMYVKLLEKEDPDGGIAERLVNALVKSGNTDVVVIFASFDITAIPSAHGATGPLRRLSLGAQHRQSEGFGNGRWACKHCTFINSAQTSICEVCSKTGGFNLNECEQVIICPQCTLLNEVTAASCDACGFPLTQVQENVQDAAVAAGSQAAPVGATAIVPDYDSEEDDEPYFRPQANSTMLP